MIKEKIKIGWVGVGRRGKGMLKGVFSQMDDVEITMLCETYEPAMELGLEIIKEAGKPEPVTTTNYDDVVNNPDLDAIVIMTPWAGRAEMAIKAMRAGKYVGIEVGCAFDLKECYDLIEAYEETGVPVMMLENCCYGRREMMAYNIADQGLYGEILHCDGAYGHYLPKEELFKDMLEGTPDIHYRIHSYIQRNCEQYPTHEFGPLSKILKLNRGNKMVTLSSFATKSRSLRQYAKEHLGEDSPYANIDYKHGDIIDTIITCINGETVHLRLDTTAPRAYYSRNFTVRGTKGMSSEEGNVVYFDDMKHGPENKNNEEEMFKKYDHPLHREYVALGEKGGHGGMDWLVGRAFVEAVKNGTNTPIDAYDTALWLAIAPLSEASINKGGAPVEVPDFTKGKWMNREPIVESKYCLDKVCIDEDTKIY